MCLSNHTRLHGWNDDTLVLLCLLVDLDFELILLALLHLSLRSLVHGDLARVLQRAKIVLLKSLSFTDIIRVYAQVV